MGIFHRNDRTHGGAGRTTIVAPGSTVKGSLRSEGGIHIDGTVLGDVEAATYVIVAEGARVEGDIHAREVYLGGLVTGDIWAVEVDRLEKGRCLGTIEAMKVNEDKQ